MESSKSIFSLILTLKADNKANRTESIDSGGGTGKKADEVAANTEGELHDPEVGGLVGFNTFSLHKYCPKKLLSLLRQDYCAYSELKFDCYTVYSEVWKLFSHSSNGVPALLPRAS